MGGRQAEGRQEGRMDKTMLQKFEGGKGYSPTVTIRANGDIGLNRGVVNRYLNGQDMAELYYDEEADVIAILPVKSNGNVTDLLAAGAIKMRSDGENAGMAIPGKAFCDRFGIDYSRKRVVKSDGIRRDIIENYGIEGLIVVSLANEFVKELR